MLNHKDSNDANLKLKTQRVNKLYKNKNNYKVIIAN